VTDQAHEYARKMVLGFPKKLLPSMTVEKGSYLSQLFPQASPLVEISFLHGTPFAGT
jgi:hypothetical protein